jgi:hypothetical protein
MSRRMAAPDAAHSPTQRAGMTVSARLLVRE